MKFIKLESRGGNYLVVAQNVAWLRAAENGQTTVGIVGGQPLLVVGSIEEVAAKIMAEQAGAGGSAPTPPPAQQPAEPVIAAEAAPALQQVAAPSQFQPESECEVEDEPAPEEREAAVDTPGPAAVPAPPMPTRSRALPARTGSLWERPAAPAPTTIKVKATSQRMMGRFE